MEGGHDLTNTLDRYLFEGKPQPVDFSKIDSLVILIKPGSARETPPASPDDGEIVPGPDIHIECDHALWQDGVDLASRRPPVIMITPNEDLGPWELSDAIKIRESLLELECPRGVSRDKNNILRSHSLPPLLKQPALMILPLGPEDVHGFPLGREVQIPNGKKAHIHTNLHQKMAGLISILPK